ncbi:hypothetical protein EVAR_78841_1, partial [Eumeta japonica]
QKHRRHLGFSNNISKYRKSEENEMTDSMDMDTKPPGTSGTGRQSCLSSNDLAMILDSSSDDETEKHQQLTALTSASHPHPHPRDVSLKIQHPHPHPRMWEKVDPQHLCSRQEFLYRVVLVAPI